MCADYYRFMRGRARVFQRAASRILDLLEYPPPDAPPLLELTPVELLRVVEEFQTRSRPARQRGIQLAQLRDGWTLQQLTTAEQMSEEGKIMKHCVATPGYQRFQLEPELGERHYTMSLRDAENRPRLTLEVAPLEEPGEGKLYQFAQIFGIGDRKVDELQDPEVDAHLEELADLPANIIQADPEHGLLLSQFDEDIGYDTRFRDLGFDVIVDIGVHPDRY